MIKVFFIEKGYFITGDGLEVSRSCPPALSIDGTRIFQPLHHEYKVLYLALKEIKDSKKNDDVMVYGASRIVDEMNGRISPLDETHNTWMKAIKRNLIPTIKSVVFFRKRDIQTVQKTVEEAHAKCFRNVDVSKLLKAPSYDRKKTILTKFRNSWHDKS